MKINFLEKSLVIFGLFWGVLGLGIYFLGLLGLFNQTIILFYIGLLLIIYLIYLIKKKYFIQKLDFLKRLFHIARSDWIILSLSIFTLLLFVLNLVLALTPEVEFDALWYHLTLPKLYLQNGSVEYIKGGLLYYSVMPRLVEMFYGFGFAVFNSAIIAKIIHFLFGIMWFFGSYIFARVYLNRKNSLLSAIAVYGLYLVTWLSATAYIDLAVGFFVIMSLWALVKYFKDSDNKFLYLSAIFMGLNLSSKTYGLMIFAVVMLILLFKAGLKKSLFYGIISLIIVSPFYIQAFLATGNPIYPVFSVPDSGLLVHLDGKLTLSSWYKEAWVINLPSLFWDVIVYRYTPLFVLVLLIFFVPNWKKVLIPILLFIGFFLLWSLVPMHEPRYFIVILPVLSMLIFYIFENTKSYILKVVIILLFFLGIISGLNQARHYFSEAFKVTFGKISKTDYLSEKLYFPQTFYDFNGNFKKEVGEQKVLTAGIHNLFYLPFKFSDWTFIEEKLDKTNPEKFLTVLRENQIDYILAGDIDIYDLTGFEKDFINQHFELMLKEGHFLLYKINF